MPALDAIDRAIIDAWSIDWRSASARADRIRSTTGLSPVESTRRLAALLTSTEAHAYDVETINRVRRIREMKHRNRASRRTITRTVGPDMDRAVRGPGLVA